MDFLKVAAAGVISAIAVAMMVYATANPLTQDTLDYSAPPPWPVLIAATWLRNTLKDASDFFAPPALKIFDGLLGINQIIAIYVCSASGWPSLLHGGARTGAEMAAHANISVVGARRLIRACISGGVFRETTATVQGIDDDKRVYMNTPLSDILRDDHPFSAKPLLGHQIEDVFPALLRLSSSWRDETIIPFSNAHGMINEPQGTWHYFEKHPKQEVQFNRAMTSADALGVPSLALDYPWAQHCSTVLDVGGGRGTLLAAILRAAPALKGVLFDLPSVIDQSEMLWTDKYPAMLGRTSFVRGSFFEKEAIPKSAGDGRHCYTSKVGAVSPWAAI